VPDIDEVGSETDSVAILRFGTTQIVLAEPVDPARLGAFTRLARAQSGTPPVDVALIAADGNMLSPSSFAAANVYIGMHLDSWLRVDDAWYGDATTLRVRLTSTGSGAIAGWQRDGAALVELGTFDLSTGRAIVNFRMSDPLGAVVLGVITPDGDLLNASLIAFPSLFRGGAHEAERLATTYFPALTSDQSARGDQAIGIVIIERDNTAVSFAMANWIANTFGASVIEGADGPVIATPDRGNGGAFELHVPGIGIPSISVLSSPVEPDETRDAATRWISVEPDGRASLISIPGTAQQSAVLPAIRHVGTGSHAASRVPLVLSASASGTRVYEAITVSESADRMTVLIDFHKGEDAVPLLASLMARQGMADIDLVLVACTDDALLRSAKAAFPLLRTLDGGRREALAQLAAEGSAAIIVLDAGIRIDDPQLLATLASIVMQDDVATVGCTVIGPDGAGGAHVITRVSMGLPPALVLREVALGSHVPGATLPVVAVSPGLCAYSGKALRALGTGVMTGSHPDLAFALHAVDAGYRNLFCDRVAAMIDRPMAGWDIVDPLPRPLSVDRWGLILAATVQIQAL
jgi:hypothetical protein